MGRSSSTMFSKAGLCQANFDQRSSISSETYIWSTDRIDDNPRTPPYLNPVAKPHCNIKAQYCIIFVPTEQLSLCRYSSEL